MCILKYTSATSLKLHLAIEAAGVQTSLGSTERLLRSTTQGSIYASIIQRVSLEWEVRYAMEITQSQLLREGNGNMEVFWVVL